MPLTLTPTCPHNVSDMDVACQADGLCPLCQKAEIERLRALLEPFAATASSEGLNAVLERLKLLDGKDGSMPIRI